jgi:hypothetical protein
VSLNIAIDAEPTPSCIRESRSVPLPHRLVERERWRPGRSEDLLAELSDLGLPRRELRRYQPPAKTTRRNARNTTVRRQAQPALADRLKPAVTSGEPELQAPLTRL